MLQNKNFSKAAELFVKNMRFWVTRPHVYEFTLIIFYI